MESLGKISMIFIVCFFLLIHGLGYFAHASGKIKTNELSTML